MDDVESDLEITGRHIRALLLDGDDARSGDTARALAPAGVIAVVEPLLAGAIRTLRSRPIASRYQVALIDLHHNDAPWDQLLGQLAEADPAVVLIGMARVESLDVLAPAAGREFNALVVPYPAGEHWALVVGAMIAAEISRRGSSADRIETGQRQILGLVRALDPVLRTALEASAAPSEAEVPPSAVKRALAKAGDDPKPLIGVLTLLAGAIAGLASAITAWLGGSGAG